MNFLDFVMIVGVMGVCYQAPGFSALREDGSRPGGGESSTESNAGSENQTNMEETEGQQEPSENISQGSDEENIESKKAVEKEKPTAKKKKKRIFSGEEAFIAGPDWEFDGFVVGGKDQEVKSMYIVNDLVYLNIGAAQGLKPGDRLGIYKRGERIRDPQSGRFLGYQVKRVATVEITNKIEDETCSVHVISANTGIEIGDLARRDR